MYACLYYYYGVDVSVAQLGNLKPEEWEKCFQQYRLASGLSAEDEERQVSTLLHCMGEGSEDVLKMTGISDDDKKV